MKVTVIGGGGRVGSCAAFALQCSGLVSSIQILDANNGEALGTSAMASTGTNDWQRIGFNFKTSEKTQAIMLKVVRYSCSNEDTPICPIFGSVWYDDFSLKRRN